MIVAVTEKFHDYEIDQYFIDTDKLNKDFYIDSLILKECKKKAQKLRLEVEATHWEEDERFGGEEPGVTSKACFKKNKDNKPIEKSLFLHIYFDC